MTDLHKQKLRSALEQNKGLHELPFVYLFTTIATVALLLLTIASCGVTKKAQEDRKKSADQNPNTADSADSESGGQSDAGSNGNSDANSDGADTAEDGTDVADDGADLDDGADGSDAPDGGSDNPQDGADLDGTNTDGGDDDPPDLTEWELLRSQPLYIYVANRNSNNLSLFKLKQDNSDIVLEKTISTAAAPGQIFIDRSKSNLYLASPNQKIFSFAISKSTGDLTLTSTLNIGYGPSYLALNKQESHIFYTSYSSSKLVSYKLGSPGNIDQNKRQEFSTGEKSHSLIASPDDKYLFVANTGASTIESFNINSALDLPLTRTSPASIPVTGQKGPRHSTFHPTLDVLYFVNEYASSVTVFSFNKTNGAITELQTISALPAGYTNQSTGADIHITPDGKYLYSSNRGHNSLAIFSVLADGKLQFIAHQSTEAIPREFALDPAGVFAFVAGQESNHLSVYRIESSGLLTFVSRHPVGTTPMWVSAIRMPP